MASIKASLKAINDAIRQQQWDDALGLAENLIGRDPNNYQAYIFKAFALDKKNQLDSAEAAYNTAVGIKPDAQAWQGLIKLYEKQGPKALPKYQVATLKLAEIFRDMNEMYKCQDVVDKFIDFARSRGDRSQYIDALQLILPDSPIYPALEGRVPHPAKTYETIAQILEVDEKKRINTLIGERRTRLGAKLSEVTLEVNREVLCKSILGNIYHQLTLWSPDDDVRRQYEEKLLQFRYDRLLVTPAPDKPAELQVVQKLANDMVIIKHPFKLAWDVAVEWEDCKDIKDWDVNVLNEYCSFFPDSDLYRVLTGFMTSNLSPFPKRVLEDKSSPAQASQADDESEDDEDGGAPTSVIPYTDEDRLLMMTEGILTTNSVLAHRLMGEYYQHLEEHESTVELMRKAMQIMVTETGKTGKVFANANQSFMLYLGTALVFYQSPRNHGEAKFLFDKVLEVDPTSTPAMIGVGLIYEEEEEYDQAIDFLTRALQGDSGNLRVQAEVGWLYALKGDYTRGKAELESLLPSMLRANVSQDLLAQTQYRLGCCIWDLDSSKAARKSRNGAYAYFLDALKSNFNYAPAYSSLGIYYEDYAKDKKRARRCFLKAVELSSAEIESAERLARSFADDGDWDRVELIAQRVVDSGKVRPPPGSKKKGISWPLSALGVAELNKQDYAKAIVSFQQALRITPDDYYSWVGLGESYHNSGRYIAATKAILNAQKFEELIDDSSKLGDTWFTKYMLANVKRELGEFDEAITLYQEVISSRPDEEGVCIALMQTMVENASDSVEKGIFGKAIELATNALSFGLSAGKDMTNTFNFWKAVGDACSIFSSVQSRIHNFPTDDVRKLLDLNIRDKSVYQVLADIDNVGKDVVFADGLFPDDEKIGVQLTQVLHATILAHKRAIYVSADDIHAQAVAYYNLGSAENRAHLCLPPSLRVQSSKYQKAAVRCFKRAIELEAGNPEFWNSLGVVASEINPSVAQHAFVRSLFLNERSAHAWSNLGALALLQNDIKLANDAFTRAQSNDPDYSHAWLGQGFVALLYGDPKEALGLFTHAMDISESSSSLTRRQYPMSLFDHILSDPANSSIASLIQPLFALTQLRSLDSQGLAYQHLSTLYQERTNDFHGAMSTLEKACEQLEANYEATESSEALARFALAKTDLARSYLTAGEYAKATDCGEMALQLSSDDSTNEPTAEQRNKARLSAHLTVGLAEYFSKNVDAALSNFEVALEESKGNPDAVCLLAQVLWAIGTDEARERARTVLFGVIEEDSSHVQSVLLLGIIALLDGDEESLDAVVSELQTLRTSDKVTDAEQSRISEVFRAVALLSENSTEDDVLTQLQNDVMLYPHLPHGWSRLAEFGGEEYPADMALKVALKAIPPRGELGAVDLSDAYAGTGKAADAQTAIFIAPWNSGGWESLGRAVAS